MICEKRRWTGVFQTIETAFKNEQMHKKAGWIVRTCSSELLSEKFKDLEEKGKKCFARGGN